jgi:hypothetical protein
MGMKTFHITQSTRGRLTLTREPAQLRRLVRAVVRPKRGEVLLFDAVDDHVHTVVRPDRPYLFARDQARAMRSALPGVVFQPAFIKPIDSRDHLENLVRYLLDQPRKHELATPPALWEGSCFLDIAGARLLPRFDRGAIGRALPRIRFREFLESVGLDPVPLEPATNDELHRVGPAWIAAAAAAVYVLDPALPGRTSEVLDARALALRTCRELGFPLRAITPYLNLPERSARRAASRPVNPAALLALRRRLAIELRVREQMARRPSRPFRERA